MHQRNPGRPRAGSMECLSLLQRPSVQDKAYTYVRVTDFLSCGRRMEGGFSLPCFCTPVRHACPVMRSVTDTSEEGGTRTHQQALRPHNPYPAYVVFLAAACAVAFPARELYVCRNTERNRTGG
jgi:hypothetical protein